jgi:hypothetical protein
MTSKEKGRLEGSPIPNVVVRQDATEFRTSLRHLQTLRLTRHCAISFAMAAAIVPYVYGDAA